MIYGRPSIARLPSIASKENYASIALTESCASRLSTEWITLITSLELMERTNTYSKSSKS